MPRLRLLSDRPRRVAMVSLHTSPLEQPGTGDAGGMNVYVDSVARALVQRGIEVEVFTRATSARQPRTAAVVPGYQVHHLPAGPFEGLRKEGLPGHLCAFSAELMRHEARRPAGWFDVLHTHYWLSGQVGWVAAGCWDVPWVHSMHTLARVKNASQAAGEHPEPDARILGEDQIVSASDLLVASTATEASELERLYGADQSKITVIHPGVDLDHFAPSDRAAARDAFGVPLNKVVLLFVGRLQPLKAPDVLIRALAVMAAEAPQVRDRVQLVICGGPSGSAALDPQSLARLAADLGVGGMVRFEPPAARGRLAQWYRAADCTLVPSHNESFGLVAVESQACGTPVIAASVGGLRTAVADGVSGLLVEGHDPREWARVLDGVVAAPAYRERLAASARAHAQQFAWSATAEGLLDGYRGAAARFRNGSSDAAAAS